MLLHIKRKWCLNHFEFRAQEQECVIGKKPYSFIILPHRIQVIYNGQIDLYARQRNILLRLLNALPILFRFPFTPYTIDFRGRRVGRTKMIDTFHITFQIAKDRYDLYTHTHLRHSIVKNGEQVALIRKDTETYMEENTYCIDYIAFSDFDVELLMFICVLVDMSYYPFDGKFAIGTKSVDVTHISGDTCPWRAEWSSEQSKS